MSITTEWLKENGLTEEQVQAVFAERGKEIAETERKHTAELSKYTDYDTIKTAYEQQGKALTALQKLEPEKLAEQIGILTEQHKTELATIKAEAAENVKKMAVKMQLSGAHDPDLLLSLLDVHKIEVDEQGNVKAGLDDQLKGLKESKGFLFKTDDKPAFYGVKPAEGGGQPAGTVTKEDYAKMGYADRFKLKTEQPELYKSLTTE